MACGLANLGTVTAWEEVAADVFRRRYQPHDVSVCVVRSAGGLLVCDTRCSHRQADEIRAVDDDFTLAQWLGAYPMTSATQRERLVVLLAPAGL